MSQNERVRHRVQSTKEEINRFFHSQKWKEMLIFSLFILLAFVFWLLQSLQLEYETDIKIPVEYGDLPSNIALEKDAPAELTVRIREKGSALLNYMVSRKRTPFAIQMPAGADTGRIVVGADELRAFVEKQIFASTRILNITPEQIDVAYGQRAEKELTVRFNGDLKFKTGFQLSGEILIRPKRVKAYASRALLDTLNEVNTTYTVIEGATKTFSRELRLEPIPGVNFETEYVAVIIPIEEYTEKTLEIPITCADIPPRYKVRMFPASIAVTCRVPLSKFKDLSEKDFEITIPFAELYENTSSYQQVMLRKSPTWIHSATLSPDKIEFLIEESH